jgi:hypothetical protein
MPCTVFVSNDRLYLLWNSSPVLHLSRISLVHVVNGGIVFPVNAVSGLWKEKKSEGGDFDELNV